MIRTLALTKTYPLPTGPAVALDHVSLHIPQGQYAAIVGPSGSGKSTLMHLLGCLDQPTEGRYFLRGRDVSTLPARELARVRGAEVGFVFQGFQLLPRLTAIENVALPLLLCGMEKRLRLQRAEELLVRVGLAERLHHRPTQLSGGQQQRVAVARALARDPALLLADEPTGNLDPQATDDVLFLLDSLHRSGRTVVLITHDGRVASRAQRQITIHGGRIVSDTDASSPFSVKNS